MSQFSGSSQWVVDSHAHLHRWMDLDLALDTAHSNFSQICRDAGLGPDTPRVLALVDPAGEADRLYFAAQSGSRGIAGWGVNSCGDNTGLRASRSSDGATVFMVQGRQVRAACGLEVLALATRETFEDGMPFLGAVAEVQQRVGFAIVPWGFGKWLGKRGRQVTEALKQRPEARILLGDNSGRAVFTPTPRPFKVAESLGIPILPGSDPLPIRGEERKLGRYGFVVSGGFDPMAPGSSLHEALVRLSSQPRIVGSREGLVPFLLSQGLQVSARITSRFFRRPPEDRSV